MTGLQQFIAPEVVPVARIKALRIVPPRKTPHETGSAAPIRSLHLNESPFPPADTVVAAMREAAGSTHRYPDHEAATLIAALAQHTGAEPDRLFVGAGSNELLAASGEVALDPGDEMVAPEPAFPAYTKIARIRGAKPVTVPVRPDGIVDVDAMVAAVGPQTRLMFVSSPHNPTGGMLDVTEIERLVATTPEHVLLHFDEAYYEFGQHAGAPLTLPILARRRGPWVSTRTFSKAYGLAGARVGYGIAGTPELAAAFRKVRPNFSVNCVALAGATAALAARDHTAGLLAHTGRERERLAAALEPLGFRAHPSAANFVTLATPAPADELAARLQADNIFVIPMAWGGPFGALRISIGSEDDTRAVIAVLSGALEGGQEGSAPHPSDRS